MGVGAGVGVGEGVGEGMGMSVAWRGRGVSWGAVPTACCGHGTRLGLDEDEDGRRDARLDHLPQREEFAVLQGGGGGWSRKVPSGVFTVLC